MRKLNVFSAVLSLFLLVPASITWAQITKTINGTVRYESGMSETKFSTPNGEVLVNLPQSMSGSVITGTVSTQPAGKTEKEKSRNLKELMKMVVSLGGQKIPFSASPSNFDWLTTSAGPGRTPLELMSISGNKVAEVSLPPVISLAAISNTGTPHLSVPSNVVVKGDALNIYTDQQFSPGEKFILTDAKGQQFTVKPVCLSSNQAVLTVPAEASVGEITVRAEKGMTVPENFGAETIRYNMIDINLTSPNTNLRPGQQSFVQASIVWDNRFTGEFDYYSVDLRNLDPNTVTMEGGNLQRVGLNKFSKKLMEGEAARIEFQLSRTITGIKPGSFSVSATLHEDYNTSNNPFRPQLNVLKTPEDFNAWADALKKDLKEYATLEKHADGNGDYLLSQAGIRANIQWAIDNMPVCTRPEQLDESKAVAYSLLQPLNIPKGAADTWLSSFDTFKSLVTSFSGTEELSKLFQFNIEVVDAGLDFMERVAHRTNDQSMMNEIINARSTGGGDVKPDGLQTLITKTDEKLKSNAEQTAWRLSDLAFSTYCFDKKAKDGIDPMKSMIGYLDPDKRILIVKPEYQQQVLNSLNAVASGNGVFRINAMSGTRTPVSYTIQILPMIVGHIYDSEWWTKHLIEEAKKDTAAGKIITTGQDSTGTWYIFYKDAECVKGSPAEKINKCYPHEVFDYDGKTGTGKFVQDGKYFNFEFLTHGSCKKGNNFCTEMLQVFRIDYIYSDKNCSKLIDILKTNGFSCL